MANNGVFLQINRMAFALDRGTSMEWKDFVVPVLNKAWWDLPDEMRVGQRLMNALGELHPEMFERIAGTHFDVWEIDTNNFEKLNLFFERVFELFVEAL
jgi:hypothetical protein